MSDPDPGSLIILKALLDAEDGFVSGNDLAEKLGLSRVSVWSRMEQLRAQGFEFEAVTRKGYRIIKKPESLNALLTQAYLEHPAECPDLVFLKTIDSTNDHATRLLANDYEAPFIVISNQQTLGRGRMGRPWHSPPSCNLYMSLGSRPYVQPDRMQLFTLWMGVYVARHLRDWLGQDIGVKWPNDLYFRGKKLGGMLTEARVDADSLRELIFGIGLNVNQTPENWPKELGPVATSLRELMGRELDLNNTAAHLIEAIHNGYQDFLAGNIRENFQTMWPKFDILKGQPVEAETRDGIIQGIASGLDNRGSLILKTNQGGVKTLSAGDVHLRRR
jgi:BirA family transcriptional regulator, biotin operon repressor / biotin---[acetyl-CoA-carboxylase] ligase